MKNWLKGGIIGLSAYILFILISLSIENQHKGEPFSGFGFALVIVSLWPLIIVGFIDGLLYDRFRVNPKPLSIFNYIFLVIGILATIYMIILAVGIISLY